MENAKTHNKRFILQTIIFSLFILVCIMTINYVVDPFFQYRVKDNKYLLNPQFSNAGLIKNHDYNTVILGSSMVQNLNLSILRENYGVKPMKLSLGGLNLKEMEMLYSNIDKSRVNTFIINIDFSLLNKEIHKEEDRFPAYLFGYGLLDRLQYLLAYETSIRYTPVDIGLDLYLKNKKLDEIPSKIRNRINIDDIGNFRDEAIYNNVDHLTFEYLYGYAVSYMDTTKMDERMKNNLDSVFSVIDMKNNPQTEYIFILPPYSALYWYHTRINHYYDKFMLFAHVFIRETEKYGNVRVICFYDLDEITDLNNYSDLTHFNPAISNEIVNNIFTHKYDLNSSNINQRLNKLDSMTNTFTEANKDWLPLERK